MEPSNKRTNERSLDNIRQFDVAANLELGKLLPAKVGMSIPVYAGISQIVGSPKFDPYDLDVQLKTKIKQAPATSKDSIRSDAQDVKTLKTISFNNVRKNNTTGKALKLWSVENFDVSYAYTKEEHVTPLIENEEYIRHHVGVGYNFAATPKYWEPFKRTIKSKSNWYKLVKDFNINPSPSLISFRGDVNRQFGAFTARNVGGPKNIIPETYNKFFTFDRYYNLRWDISRSLNFDFNAVNRARVDEDSGRLSKAERNQMWNNFWKGGRNITYNQTANLTYTLPMQKIPLLDWTTIRMSYVARYNWLAASRDVFAKSLGNFIGNGQEKNITGELDFTRLYGKSRLLRALDWDAPVLAPEPPSITKTKAATDSTAKGKKKKEKVKRDPNQLPEINGAIKIIGRLITSIKRVNVQYGEVGVTNLAGYTDSTRILGMNIRSMAPGWGFIAGRQPDTAFVNGFAKRGLIVRNPLMNNLNRQDFNQRLSITAQLIPVRDLIIDINLDKTFGKSYSELYKDTVASGNSEFVRLSPYTTGSFNVSFISFKTLFGGFKANEVSKTFKTFETNRLILSQRLGKDNPYSAGQVNAEGFFKGYGKYAQDVLIPSFVAAYTGKDPNTVSVVEQNNPNIRSNPFAGYLPKPNWRVTYNGLTRIPGMEKIFTNFTMSHAYNSNLSMNSFNSALLFEDPYFLTGQVLLTL